MIAYLKFSAPTDTLLGAFCFGRTGTGLAREKYVWFDALTNYLNGVGYANDKTTFAHHWESADRIIHVIGKHVLKFHVLYWSAILASTGVRQATELRVQGFLAVNGQKISKSLGNAVDPFPIIQRYGGDTLKSIWRIVDSIWRSRRFGNPYKTSIKTLSPHDRGNILHQETTGNC